jgi:hypothetical protein
VDNRKNTLVRIYTVGRLITILWGNLIMEKLEPFESRISEYHEISSNSTHTEASIKYVNGSAYLGGVDAQHRRHGTGILKNPASEKTIASYAGTWDEDRFLGMEVKYRSGEKLYAHFDKDGRLVEKGLPFGLNSRMSAFSPEYYLLSTYRTSEQCGRRCG